MSSTDGDKGSNQKDKVAPETAQSSRTIFSKEDVEATVKGFILAYLRGKIKINYPSAEYYEARSKIEGQPIDVKKAVEKETNLKTQILTLIEICSGTRLSTPEELQKSINDLFSLIMAMRMGDRIEGEFLRFDIEQRIEEVENRLETLTKLIYNINKHIERLGV